MSYPRAISSLGATGNKVLAFGGGEWETSQGGAFTTRQLTNYEVLDLENLDAGWRDMGPLPFTSLVGSAFASVGDSAFVELPGRFGAPPAGWVEDRLKALRTLRSPDVNFLNFESTLTRSCTKFADKPFAFASPPEALAQFAAWGFNLMSLANNHTFDCVDPAPEGEIEEVVRASMWHPDYVPLAPSRGRSRKASASDRPQP